MKIAIGVLFVLAMALFVLGSFENRSEQEVASVGSGIVLYALGAAIGCVDAVLLIGYALWRLFA